MTVEQIARLCHEANRDYCYILGDNSQLPWFFAEDWQRESARAGVQGILSGQITSPVAAHDSWCKQKFDAGWVYGKVKDPEKKTHPCLVSYDALPEEQRAKDHLMFAIVRAMESSLNE